MILPFGSGRRSRGEKRAIGREAAKLIGNGEVIAIDAGTTALKCQNITCTDVIIITASPHVALNSNQGTTSVLNRGVMRPKTFTLAGLLLCKD